MEYTEDEIKAMYDYWKMLYGKEVADEYLEYLKKFYISKKRVNIVS